VKCSQVLVDEITKAGGVPVMWKTGHTYIKTKMKEEKAAIAGERSGHIFYNDNWYGFDDGIYASLRLVEFLSHQEKSMAALVDELPPTVSSPMHYMDCDDAVKFEVLQKIVTALKEKELEIIDIDGARVRFEHGFGAIRASSTQPALTFVAEANTEENLNKIKSFFKDFLKNYPEVAEKWSNE